MLIVDEARLQKMHCYESIKFPQTIGQQKWPQREIATFSYIHFYDEEYDNDDNKDNGGCGSSTITTVIICKCK